MKRKISVRLSEEIVERLEAAARERPGANKTTILEAALDRFLDPAAETIDDATLLRRLDCMSRHSSSSSTPSKSSMRQSRCTLDITSPSPRRCSNRSSAQRVLWGSND